MEDKYLKYLDPLSPIHYLTLLVARAILCKIRLLIHHPRNGNFTSRSERDTAFLNALRVVEYSNLALSSKLLQRFVWHMTWNFQYDPFIFMVSELQARPDCELAHRAWRQIESTYDFKPWLVDEVENPLYTAICKLVLRAWEARAKVLSTSPQMPNCVKKAYTIHGDGSDATTQGVNEASSRQMAAHYITTPASASFEEAHTSSSGNKIMDDLNAMDWNYWDSLITGIDFTATDDGTGMAFPPE
jgi:hypothetical protein